MMDTIKRARLLGAMVLVAAFAAGIAVGHYLWPRPVPEGVVVSIKASGRIPAELEELELTDTQRDAIRAMLFSGTERVGRIMRGFTAPLNAAIDSTDREIRSILSETQNRRLDEIRKDRPLKRMREKRIIDSIR